MARKRERFFGVFIAAIFLLTSSALTIAAITQMWQEGRQNGSDNATVNTQTNTEDTNVDQGKQLLTGTKMQGFEPQSEPQTELKVIDVKVGDGAEVKPGATVTASYVGALMKDGTIFDASADHGGPISFGLNQVIKGWTDGIPGMKVGGTRRLLIPAEQGYGAQGAGSIPANADLVFDVTITDTK